MNDRSVGLMDIIDQTRIIIAEWLMTLVWHVLPKGTREKESYRLSWNAYNVRTLKGLEEEQDAGNSRRNRNA